MSGDLHTCMKNLGRHAQDYRSPWVGDFVAWFSGHFGVRQNHKKIARALLIWQMNVGMGPLRPGWKRVPVSGRMKVFQDPNFRFPKNNSEDDGDIKMIDVKESDNIAAAVKVEDEGKKEEISAVPMEPKEKGIKPSEKEVAVRQTDNQKTGFVEKTGNEEKSDTEDPNEASRKIVLWQLRDHRRI